MTTTELIRILKENECGGISHKPRKISLTINDKYYMSNPQITLSSTGDGVVGPEIDLDIDGELFEEETLEQANTLDKIRAEVEKLYSETDTCSFLQSEYEVTFEQGKERAYLNVIDIIDKYREQKESEV